MRAYLHDGQEPHALHPRAGYIGARPKLLHPHRFLLQRTAGPYIGVKDRLVPVPLAVAVPGLLVPQELTSQVFRAGCIVAAILLRTPIVRRTFRLEVPR